ncbi:MAG: hypothetical protein V3U71_08805 [Cocleimonas sp.]
MILDTLSEAFWSLIEFKAPIIKVLTAPFILLVIFSLFEFFYTDKIPLTISLAVPFLIGMTAAITIHRIILVGERSVSISRLFKLNKRNIKFISSGIVVILLIVPLLFLSVIPLFGKPLTLLIIFYFFSRFSLVFPAIASDNSISFMQSWKATNSFKTQQLVLIVGIILTTLIAIGFLIQAIPGVGWLASLVVFIMLIYMSAVLSIVYKNIVKLGHIP